VKVRKPSLDKVVQLAAKQKEKIDKTLNNTQKMIGLDQINLATLNSNQVKLSSNSSAAALP
jgi:hypothetical protein